MKHPAIYLIGIRKADGSIEHFLKPRRVSHLRPEHREHVYVTRDGNSSALAYCRECFPHSEILDGRRAPGA